MKEFLVIVVCILTSTTSGIPKVRVLQMDGDELTVVEKNVPKITEPESAPKVTEPERVPAENLPKVRILEINGDDLNVVEKDIPETTEPENDSDNLPAGLHGGEPENVPAGIHGGDSKNLPAGLHGGDSENVPAGLHDGKDDMMTEKAALVSSLYFGKKNMTLDDLETRQEQISFIMNDCELSETTDRYGYIKKKYLKGIKKKNVLEHFKEPKKRYKISIYKSGKMKCNDGEKEKVIYYKLCTLEGIQFCEWLEYKLDYRFKQVTMNNGTVYKFPNRCSCKRQ